MRSEINVQTPVGLLHVGWERPSDPGPITSAEYLLDGEPVSKDAARDLLMSQDGWSRPAVRLRFFDTGGRPVDSATREAPQVDGGRQMFLVPLRAEWVEVTWET